MAKIEPHKAAVIKPADHADETGAGDQGFGTEEIWKNALKKFKTENRIDEAELKEFANAASLGDADTGVKKATEMFKTWRHPPEPNTKIMEAVSGCLDWVDTAAGFIKDHVSGTYATPVQLITGAVSKMIKAAKDMSDDFNLIEKTFKEIHEAIKDIDQLDKRARNEKEETFVHRLIDVFISIFEFSYFSSKMFEASRKRRYMRALVKGPDEKIQEKCNNVTTVILLFRANVPFKILSEVEKMNEKIDLIPDTFKKVIQGLSASDLLPLTQSTSALEMVKNKLGIKTAATTLLESHRLLIKSNYVEGTFSWLKEDPDYKDWFRAQKTPFLCVSGPPGTGKTFLTYRCYQLIQEMTKTKTTKADANITRQSISVAYFFFDPGSETHSLRNALKHVIIQIASQDLKFCDSVSKDLNKGGYEKMKDAPVEDIWKNFLSTKFDKTPELSRMAYILLDGVDQLSSEDSLALLGLFKDLSCDKTGIQIMMTGDPDKLKEMNLKPCEINLLARAKEHEDIKTIIKYKMKTLKNLKDFSPKNREKILDRLDSQSEGVISFVDLTLSVMDQSGSEGDAMKQIETKYSTTSLYDSMIGVVINRRSPSDRISVPTLFAWCTYAKERLTVHELQQIWELDPSLSREFNVMSEIQGRSNIMLYTTTQISDEEKSDGNDGERKPTEEDDPTFQPPTVINNTGGTTSALDPKLEVVQFRQSALGDYLDTPPNKPPNKMIENALAAKVQIFTTLCKVLSDDTGSELESRKALHKYATSNLVNHLMDIDVIKTTPPQGRDVVEALSRVLTDKHNVCTIFEAVMHEKDGDYWSNFPLYDDPDTAKRILAWAKKMSFFEDEELTDTATTWINATVKNSAKLFESLARGHVENLSKQTVADQAVQPYRLAYHALGGTERLEQNYGDDNFYAWYLGRMNAKAANTIIDFSKEIMKDTPVDLARTRIALALLLNSSDMSEDRQLAADLYKQNLDSEDATPGPEKFYSYLGLAEYYASPITEDETKEARKARWEDVLKNADSALQQREDEKGALGSELDNERCTIAVWLKADAHQKLDQDGLALQTCTTKALAAGELGYTKQNKKFLDFLSMVLSIHAKKHEYVEIIAQFSNCPYKMRAEWMWHRWDYPTDKRDSLREAAVVTRRVDFLVQIYEEAIDYHKQNQNWYGAHILAIDLAMIYRRDARATKMGEITLDNIMKEVKGNMLRSDAAGVLRNVFPQTVDVLFENYYVTRSDASKAIEVKKLYQLVHDLGSTTYIDQMSRAAAFLTLAKMLKGIGKVRFAKVQADKAFSLCMEDLSDSFTYNDKDGFRMLGKILMFADLDVDAAIALSLQDSEVDKSHEDSLAYEAPAASTKDDGESVAANGVDAATATADETLTEQPNQNSLDPNPAEGSKGKAVEEPQQEQSENGIVPEPAEGSEQKAAEEPQQHPVENGVEPALAEGSKQKASDEPSQHPAENGVEPALAEGSKQKAIGEPPQLIPNSDPAKPFPQDLIPEGQRGIICNGSCDWTEFKTWQDGVDVYFCLDCHEVEYCPVCHAKQLNYFTKTGEAFWFKSCWAKHEFIHLPVKDWRGVKGGVIRIGAKQKPFKLWLAAVRDKWNAKLATM